MNVTLFSRFINSRIALIALIAALAVAAAMAGAGMDGGSPAYAQTTVDYDVDDDGLIDVVNLAQLNAMRHDLNGDGDVAAGAPLTAYNAAFPSRVTAAAGRMGCPGNNGCTGYELRADLNFDTDGDGITYTGTGTSAASDSGDTYHNGGSGWAPIGGDANAAARYNATFKGNGHTISNMFIKRATTDAVGLFGALHTDARVESVSVLNAHVYGQHFVGVIAGSVYGDISATYVSGAVFADRYAGGMAGAMLNSSNATITAAYSAANVTQDGSPGHEMGGLVGLAGSTTSVTASFSTGTVTTSGSNRGGLIGSVNSAATVTDSYWDALISGIADDGDTTSPEGKTTDELQAPVGYTGLFSAWNVSVDGVTGADDPWDFGGAGEYPAIKYGGMNPEDQLPAGNYDKDGDGLVEITTLAQLNAVRWDLNGDAVQGTTSATNWASHAAAFPNALGSLGCPDTADSGTDPGPCAGYELAAHLDFDTDGDGATYTGTLASPTSDSGDTYHNSGSGWLPIESGYSATFKGNGYIISNLFINRATTNQVGLFSRTAAAARIESLGLANAYVAGQWYVGGLVGENRGTIAASWTSGAVRGVFWTGGLVGRNNNFATGDVGDVIACYSHASVHTTQTTGDAFAGGLVGVTTGNSLADPDLESRIIASYSTGAVTAASGVTEVEGLAIVGTGTVTNSYWDSDTSGKGAYSGIPDGHKTTEELQSTTHYGGIYADWNVDVDGETGVDNPWDFGTSSQYPVLKYGGMDPIIQRGDYDLDDDGLIDIRTLAQLDAIRWDRDGQGDQDSATAAEWVKYGKAFLNYAEGMGCPDTDDSGTEPGPCVGYELLNDLDFDTNGNGYTYTGTGTGAEGDPDDAYYDGGSGWNPIPSDYTSTFVGNGNVIFNLFVKRSSLNEAGLFRKTNRDGRVESLGVVDAYVYGAQQVGILMGENEGKIIASWTSGYVRGTSRVGGLVGRNSAPSGSGSAQITASYSRAAVDSSGGNARAGGLVGHAASPIGRTNSITASYSTGTVSAASGATDVGGLIGLQNNTTVSAVYWDTTTSGRTTAGTQSSALGKTTAELQSPAGYVGIYAAWNLDLDGDGAPDDPWEFGTSSQYPVLKYGGMDPYIQYVGGDFDLDDDGLIEINSLARLNAVRYDLDGDGLRGGTHADDWKKYQAAFRVPLAAGMGCPDTEDADTDPGPCLGYELVADLDFDTDGDGSTYTGSGADAVGDPGDAYYNGGEGWAPLGPGWFTGKFKGNGNVVSNLYINRPSGTGVGLFSRIARAGSIETLGVKDAYVSGRWWVGNVVGNLRGLLSTSFAVGGEARGELMVGGLVGLVYGYYYPPPSILGMHEGRIHASYAMVDVHASDDDAGGLVGRAIGNRANITASYATGTVTSPGESVGGFAGFLGVTLGAPPMTVTQSYWDKTASGTTDGGNTGGSPLVPVPASYGRTTAELFAPTGYTGIYSEWNMDLDGDGEGDDPWDFRGEHAYPVLKYGGMDPEKQRLGDYDVDGDGLIDISTLARLDAVRWDLDGDGVRGSAVDGAAAVSDSDWQKYEAAFHDRDTSSANLMGCPSGTCAGYELFANLDFDTDGDGSTYTGTGASATSDSGDAYHNGGAGWAPIGPTFANRYSATFKGNGYAIENLFIRRTTTDLVGLFGASGGRVESMSVDNAYVYGNRLVGILAGGNYSEVVASYTSGYVRGRTQVGGLVGHISPDGSITAGYSTADAHAQPAPSTDNQVGGLVGRSSGAVTAGYATGAVTSSGGTWHGGLAGYPFPPGTYVNSYWDTISSGITATGNGEGKTTAELQEPTGYTGDFADWNIDLDGDGSPDDPWDFGGIGAYPALKYGGMNPDYQRRGDFDQDGDGFIEIRNLAHLDAVRYDLNADGLRGSVSVSNWQKYNAAFEVADPGMGCIDTDDADTDPGPCAGYELVNDLDFDTNGNGYTYTGTGTGATSDPGDAYHNGGAGWAPIGIFASTFKGNGYVISNLFIKRTSTDNAGLFSLISSAARVETVGVSDAYVYARRSVGAVVGMNEGKVVASWSTGYVRGTQRVGGLVGRSRSSGVSAEIIASYSHAEVHATQSGNARGGGLVGALALNSPPNPMITASYSTGTVPGTSTELGGLVGYVINVTGGAIDSYWDTTTSRSNSYRGSGRTTAQLQGPASYTGIYANWNLDLDGDGVPDDPWHFGEEGAYPVLKYGGMDPEDQRHGDYDQDGDGLIDISSLAQLDAVRYDLNGNATQDTASAADWKKYAAAFPGFAGATTLMGCPSGTCAGYELTSDLDFDTDGDGATYAGTGNDAAGDPGDAYYNGGAGWLPIGDATRFASTFKGNGHVVSNLFVKRPTTAYAGLFGAITDDARVESVGVENVYVYGMSSVGGLLGSNQGMVAASYSTGHVRGNESVGGLIGYNSLVLFVSAGHVNASYSHASVASADGTTQYIGGFVGYASAGSTINASYSTGTVTSSHASSGGFVGDGSFIGTNPATVTNSYWNTTTSGRTTSLQGTGKTTAELQAPTGYDGIYAAWNVDADGTAGGDDPWDFGGSSDYPVLKYGGMSHYTQRGDYDTDNDGLIEITNLDQLNAMRWDLNGDAVQDTTSAADWRLYSAAFRGAIAGFGCPGACRGYELADNLTFGGDAKYSNWTPVGDSTTAFGAAFEGNGYVISDLKIRRDGAALGLFGATSSGSTITRVGLPRAFVKATSADDSTLVGALIGSHGGTLRESYATGDVAQAGAGTGGDYGGLIGSALDSSGVYASWADVAVTAVAEDADAGGFVGGALADSTIRAAHAKGAVAASGEDAFAGGFIGAAEGTVGAAYATGVPTAAGTGGTAGGFHARAGASPTFTAVYWDATTSTIADDADSDAPEGVTTANLQSPTDYTGIYADWNDGTLGDVDGTGGADDPWDFGTATQYPALKFGVQDPYVQRGDYDADDDGLIEITTLDRLNAIRWDLNGDAVQDTTTAADWRLYNLAFLNADAGMGCPAACAGYELAANLDFDANGDGAVDSDDPYPNWLPIGLTATGSDPYGASFAGNNMTIANLTINSGRGTVGLFNQLHLTATESVTGVGLPDANITATGNSYAGTLAGRVTADATRGTIRYSWATGSVTHTGTGASSAAGGLIGRLAGDLEASWADVDVSSTGPGANVGGLVGLSYSYSITASYAAGDVAATGASAEAGGLTGRAHGGPITASYATGAVTSTGFASAAGGLAGSLRVGAIGPATVTHSYWDATTSGIPDDVDKFSPEGITTAALQTPTGYDGIYANWNADVDDTTGADDPWDFGASNQYPILDVGDMDTTIQPRAAERTPVITAPVQIEIPCAWIAHPSALVRCP